MRMNKEKFLKTEFGAELKGTIEALMFYINEQSKIPRYDDPDEFGRLQKDIDKLFAQWSVYQLAVKQFLWHSVSFYPYGRVLCSSQQRRN